MKREILFLCTGNSCRSQMAEGWAHYLLGDSFTPFSAGVEVHGMNERAIQVMSEVGIDLSDHRSKHIDEFDLSQIDTVITVCDHASESCPFVPPSCNVIHRSFPDPPKLAEGLTDDEEILSCYRRVRDEIRLFIEALPDILKERREIYD